MTNSGCLDGKVIAVSGAGRGIGRAIAMLAAAEGAKVVVNDLGSSIDGAGTDASTAQAVVDEIEAGGGEAVANGESVAEYSGAGAILMSALDNFGRIDGIVNNAGILRDGIFHKMSPDDWAAVINVHLMGAFNLSRAAATYFREQQSGAFVHMTSTSGLIGNIGQANYSAAKAGIVALSKSIALEMQRFNVRSNCVSPFAWSRMIGAIPTDTADQKARVEKLKQMTPEKVAPMVVYLLGEGAASVSGQIFAVRNNEIFLMGQSRPLRSVHRADGWSPAKISDHAIPAMEKNFFDLDVTADVFSWDPI